MSLPFPSGNDDEDYKAGWSVAAGLLREGKIDEAIGINMRLGGSDNLRDWVSLGFHSALTMHFQAQKARGDGAIQ